MLWRSCGRAVFAQHGMGKSTCLFFRRVAYERWTPRRSSACQSNTKKGMRNKKTPTANRGVFFELSIRRKVARVTGLEPAASGVTGRRSNQLSYTRSVCGAVSNSRSEGAQDLF